MKHLIFILLVVGQALHAVAQWEPINSPFGGPVLDMVQSDGTLFVKSGLRWFRHQPEEKGWKKLTETKRERIYPDFIVQQDNAILIIFRDYTKNTNNLDLRRTYDLGSTWEELILPDTSLISGIVSSPFAIYLTTEKGVYYSIDQGNTWNFSTINDLSEGPGFLYAYDQKIFFSAGGYVFRSSTQADSWTAIEIKGNDSNYKFYAFDSTYIAVGLLTHAGFHSGDEGQTWMEIDGIDWQFENFIRIRNAYYGHTFEHIYKSVDHGQSFDLIDSTQFIGLNKIMPLQDSLLLGDQRGLIRMDTNITQGAFYIKNFDASIINSIRPFEASFLCSVEGVGAIKMDPENNADHRIVLDLEDVADVIEIDGIIYAVDESDIIWMSEDNGTSWHAYTQPDFTDFAFYHFSQDQQALYVVGKLTNEFGMPQYPIITFRHDLNGNGSWTPYPIDEIDPDDYPVVIHQMDPYIFAMYRHKIARWSQAEGWKVVREVTMPVTEMLRFIANENLIGYFEHDSAYFENAFYISPDFGDTWITANIDDFHTPPINSGFINGCFVGSRIIAYWGQLTEGIFISDDLGQTWTPINEGLSFAGITEFLVEGEYIYVGTSGKGIYRRKIQDLNTSIEPHDVSHDQSLHVFPNPGHGDFTVMVPDGLQGKNSLFITDLTGQLILQEEMVGQNIFHVDGHFASPGSYLVIVMSGGKRRVSKIVVLP